MNTGHVRIFYPADPLGVVPGGIDTFIRGILKWAPPELDFSLVGMTTDAHARPVGRWTTCRLGSRTFDFYPVVHVADAGARSRVPLSLRFTAGAWRHRRALREGFDVYDFHRPEPSLLYLDDARPKNAYWHQDPRTIDGAGSDNRWRRLPGAYERLEARAVRQLASAWCVRETGVATLLQRYPSLQGRVRFLPTWVDADVFHPVPDAERQALRSALAQRHGVSAASGWIAFVGRLDTQKNPALLLEAFAKLVRRGRDASLLMVGDGVLRRDLQRQARAAGVAERVHFLGLQPQAEIARLLQAADLFALSSAYEGMPMALLEALGCGTPAVVTDVGEVRRVVQSGRNGIVVEGADAQAFAQGLVLGLDASGGWRDAAVAAVVPFQPARVLQPVYANYLALAAGPTALREQAARQDREAGATRRRETVLGVPVDVKRSSEVVGQVVRWARQRESRAVCFCNVHSAALAASDPMHAWSLRGADLVVPDGAPVAWTLRRKGHPRQDRVDGPGTMWRVLGAAREHGVRIGLYGGTAETLHALQLAMGKKFPGLQVVYAHSPPFREPTAEEDARDCLEIERAGVGLLLVGLGCPKQERWIAQHRGRVPAVMLGVGAAFDFHAGTVARAPSWMRENGMEWLHRLGSEPRRLWWRYLSSNTRFVVGTLRDALAPSTRGDRRAAGVLSTRPSSGWPVTEAGVVRPVLIGVPPAPPPAAASAAAAVLANAAARRSADPLPPARPRLPFGGLTPAIAVAGGAGAGSIGPGLRRPSAGAGPGAAAAPRPVSPPAPMRSAGVADPSAGAASVAAPAGRRPVAPVTAKAPPVRPADAAAAAPAVSAARGVPLSPPVAPPSRRPAAPPAVLPPQPWAKPGAPPVFADLLRPGHADPLALALAQQPTVAELVARLDAELPGVRSRIVGFVASRSGEGTSTLALAYALASARRTGQRVLLLRTGPAAEGLSSVVDAVRDGAPLPPAAADRGPVEAALGVGGDGERQAAWGIATRTALWQSLRDAFDLVVLDIESGGDGDVALRAAPLCDGVVVVLEAGRTRTPVVAKLLHDLQAVRARVLGTVLNKRQFQLPAWLYRWL